MKRGWGRTAGAAMLVGVCVFESACGCGKAAGGEGGARIERGPVPGYAEVASKYNERVRPLERLWATAVVVIRYRDKEGGTRREQGEGHVQVIRPDRLAMSVGKVGETYFWLGGDAERYWWFEREGGKRMWVGRYDAIGAHAEWESPPIHPLDLIELLAITPLPDAGGETAWSEDGTRVVVTAPARVGRSRAFLDPTTLEPSAIELLDAQGVIVIRAELSDYEGVTVIGSGLVPRMPGFIAVTIPGREAEVTIRLNDQESGPKRPKAAAFNFEQIVRSLGPSEVVDVDRPARGGAEN